MSKVKFVVNSDEWYPVYDVIELETAGYITLEATREQLDRWAKAKADHAAAIAEIDAIIEASPVRP